tara:strand:+ start:1557 stop:1901 length:345 start_codon:yes stop_codon:yes gene_type:complete
MRASRKGDIVAVRRCFLNFKVSEMDTESALDAASAHARFDVVKFLVSIGAKKLDSALLSAVAMDDARIVGFLISHERPHPAENVQNAHTLASSFGSLNAEWTLARHLLDKNLQF